MLEDFRAFRAKNLEAVHAKNLTGEELQLKGLHPSPGEVALSELMAAWAVHDLNHPGQISTGKK